MLTTEPVSNYKVIQHSSIPDLEAEVKQLLSSGWLLFGTPFTSGMYNGQINQAFVRSY